jgi:hypothetical protein
MFSHRMQKRPEVLYYILQHLSNIWTQSEWKANVINLFCNCPFRTTFLNVIVFFEKELEICLKRNSSEIDQKSSISYATLTTLLQLILPALLMVKDYPSISLLVNCGCVNSSFLYISVASVYASSLDESSRF